MWRHTMTRPDGEQQLALWIGVAPALALFVVAHGCAAPETVETCRAVRTVRTVLAWGAWVNHRNGLVGQSSLVARYF